jgi:hypothetical protein
MDDILQWQLSSTKSAWRKNLGSNCTYSDVIVPNMRVGRCLGPEGNGVSSREGGEGGPGPPSREEDEQSTPNKECGNMEQEEGGRTGRA